MPDWLIAVLLVLNAVMSLVILLLTCLISSGVAQVIASQESLVASMQVLSNQMSDAEDDIEEIRQDMKKISQNIANIGKAIRNPSDKAWYSGV